MFEEKVLETILSDPALKTIPLSYISDIIKAVYEVLDNMDLLKDGAKDGI